MAEAAGGVTNVVWQAEYTTAESLGFIGISLMALFPDPYLTLTAPQTVVSGRIAVDQVLRLPRNAIFRAPFSVTVEAGRARWVRASDVAEIRVTDLSNESSGSDAQTRTGITLDFGGLRTVSGVGLADASSHAFIQVRQWSGVGFLDQALYGPYGTITSSTSSRSVASLQPKLPLPAEAKTERLQIVVNGELTEGAARNLVLVELPDLPGDVDLSIAGGPPVWRAPGPVRDGFEGWVHEPSNDLFRQEVDIADALTALLGDPAADVSDTVDLRLTLSAAIPGVLILRVPDAPTATPGGAIRHVTAVDLAGRDRHVFDQEGVRNVALELPSWAGEVDAVTLSITGEMEPVRVFPPTGPDYPVLADGTTPRAEMVLDADHAAAIDVLDLRGLDELTGVRLPLRTEAGDAEVRVMLLANDAGQPGDPVPGGVSEPIILPASSVDTWYTFEFAEPVPVDPAAPPIVAVVPSRGRVLWILTDDPDAGGAWRGPPTGPWAPLPDAGGLAGLRARMRIMGTASPDVPPVPALRITLGDAGDGVAVTPVGDGVEAEVEAPAPVPAGSAEAVIVSHSAGELRLVRAVAVVTRAPGA